MSKAFILNNFVSVAKELWNVWELHAIVYVILDVSPQFNDQQATRMTSTMLSALLVTAFLIHQSALLITMSSSR